MEHSYTAVEIVAGIIGVLLTIAFGGWGAIVKKSADDFTHQIERVINELSQLREEIHRDRVVNERRFTRLEQTVGVAEKQ